MQQKTTFYLNDNPKNPMFEGRIIDHYFLNGQYILDVIGNRNGQLTSDRLINFDMAMYVKEMTEFRLTHRGANGELTLVQTYTNLERLPNFAQWDNLLYPVGRITDISIKPSTYRVNVVVKFQLSEPMTVN